MPLLTELGKMIRGFVATTMSPLTGLCQPDWQRLPAGQEQGRTSTTKRGVAHSGFTPSTSAKRFADCWTRIPMRSPARPYLLPDVLLPFR
jgi:hypothetical protein